MEAVFGSVKYIFIVPKVFHILKKSILYWKHFCIKLLLNSLIFSEDLYQQNVCPRVSRRQTQTKGSLLNSIRMNIWRTRKGQCAHTVHWDYCWQTLGVSCEWLGCLVPCRGFPVRANSETRCKQSLATNGGLIAGVAQIAGLAAVWWQDRQPLRLHLVLGMSRPRIIIGGGSNKQGKVSSLAFPPRQQRNLILRCKEKCLY